MRRPHHRAVGVGVGLPRQALHLDVHDQPAAGVERLVERGELAAEPRAASANARRRDQPDAGDLGIVVHDEHAVGGAPHVELDAVGAELTRRA